MYMNSAPHLLAEDRPEFERILDEALRTVARASGPGTAGLTSAQLRAMALGASSAISACAAAEYDHYIAVREKDRSARQAERAEAVRRGITQYVLLGAGLDSFAYRCEPAGELRVFEVDHPASQAAKRRCLAAAGVTEPPHVAFVPADFETASPLQRLADAGFDPGRPALVSWLGVTMYLSRTAIAAVLAEVGGLAPGTELVGDYFLPEDLRDATGQAYAEAVAPVSAELGEPWRGCLRPEEMTALLTENGFTAIRHVSTRESVEPALWRRTDGLGPHDLSRLVHARVADRRG